MPQPSSIPANQGAPDDGLSGTRRITRRRAVAGIAGAGATAALAVGGYVGAAQAGVDLPVGARIRRKLGACGDDPGIPDIEPGSLVAGLMDESWMGRETKWFVSYPPGHSEGDELPVVIVLHGAEGTAFHAFEAGHGLDRFQAADIADRGVAPYALAAVDGHLSFWHDRANGEQPQSMLTEAFLPLLADMGLNTIKPAIHGWGSGAAGAMLLALRLGPDRVGPVGALSPALFSSFEQANNIADVFDEPGEFAALNLEARADELAQLDLRLDCGADDPFAEPTRRLRNALANQPAGAVSQGCRTQAFWHRQHPLHLAHVIKPLHADSADPCALPTDRPVGIAELLPEECD